MTRIALNHSNPFILYLSGMRWVEVYASNRCYRPIDVVSPSMPKSVSASNVKNGTLIFLKFGFLDQLFKLVYST